MHADKETKVKQIMTMTVLLAAGAAAGQTSIVFYNEHGVPSSTKYTNGERQLKFLIDENNSGSANVSAGILQAEIGSSSGEWEVSIIGGNGDRVTLVPMDPSTEICYVLLENSEGLGGRFEFDLSRQSGGGDYSHLRILRDNDDSIGLTELFTTNFNGTLGNPAPEPVGGELRMGVADELLFRGDVRAPIIFDNNLTGKWDIDSI